VNSWRASALLLFPVAALVLGTLGAGVLWVWSYQKALRPSLALPLAWTVEVVAYLVLGRRCNVVGRVLGLLLGLVTRAVMAAASAAIWPSAGRWSDGFVTYYACYWPGMALQILMASMLVWFAVELAGGPGELVRVGGGEEVLGAADRRRLLDELLAPAQEEGAGVGGESLPETGGEEAASPAPPLGEPAQAEAEPAAEAPAEGRLLVGVGVSSEREGEEAEMGAAATVSTAEQDTSELPAVRAGTGGGEVVAWAVAEAGQRVSGQQDLRPLPLVPGARVHVIANLPAHSDAAAVSEACLRLGAAAAFLGRFGLVGEPLAAMALWRAGGMVVVPGQQALVCVRATAPPNLALLAAQARRLAAALQAAWPEVEAIGLRLELPEVTASESLVPAVDSWAQEAGQQALWQRVEGMGATVVVGSAGCEAGQAAAAAGLLWRALVDFGRLVTQGGPRRALLTCTAGAGALAWVQADGGTPLLLVRLAPGAQPGLAAAEVERLAALCQESPSG
jgi:hypothetical protein